MYCKNCTGLTKMDLFHATDNINGNYAYNLWVCGICDTILKENVWGKCNQIWIDNNDNVEVIET